jgi:hypothetical protein
VVYGKLSMLGGLAINDAADFARVFGAHSVKGLYDRFIFGYSECNGGMVEGTVQLTARSTPNRKPTAEAVGFVACVMASYAVAPKTILQAFWRVSIAAGFR